MQKTDLNDLATECCFSQEKTESTTKNWVYMFHQIWHSMMDNIVVQKQI